MTLDKPFQPLIKVDVEEKELTLREWAKLCDLSEDEALEQAGFDALSYEDQDEALEDREYKLDSDYAFLFRIVINGKEVLSERGVNGRDAVPDVDEIVSENVKNLCSDYFLSYLDTLRPAFKNELNDVLGTKMELRFSSNEEYYGKIEFEHEDFPSLSIRFLKDHKQKESGGYHAVHGQMGEDAIDLWLEYDYSTNKPVLHAEFNHDCMEEFQEQYPEMEVYIDHLKAVLNHLDGTEIDQIFSTLDEFMDEIELEQDEDESVQPSFGLSM